MTSNTSHAVSESACKVHQKTAVPSILIHSYASSGIELGFRETSLLKSYRLTHSCSAEGDWSLAVGSLEDLNTKRMTIWNSRGLVRIFQDDKYSQAYSCLADMMR